MKFCRFGFVVSALLCILMVSAFAAEPEYTYEFGIHFPPEYATISYDGDMVSVYVEDAFFEAFEEDVSREEICSVLSGFDWQLTVNGVQSPNFFLDWSVGSFSFRYSEDGIYEVSADSLELVFSLGVTLVPVSSDSASVPGILSAVSDVFAAVLGLVALLAAAFAVHPILLIGVVLGFFGLVIAIFRRLFV
ncbi:hypothetical protein [Intestinimonas massiliensis (ex Afouda et al. 2020)]|uniref:hypothetical protein n=1 Tax=Intestinimonas massiliensis (ex Afouda et al. 2020) TaxID=1673721 RepID=UPI00102F70C1|nr:hypothetical protein [Intestinimonas massiliensis (ex Afouda et al. 2020)]